MDGLIWNIRSVKTMQAFEKLITMHKQHHFEFTGLMELNNKLGNWRGIEEELDLLRRLQMSPIQYGCSLMRYLKLIFYMTWYIS